MKKNLLVLGLFILAISVPAQTPRLSLYEEFTGETCPPCAAVNPYLNSLLASPTNSPKVVAIKWQVPIPSASSKPWSLYQTNKTEINWRYSQYGYGVNSAPTGRMDGRNVTAFGASSDHPANLNDNVIATAQSYTSPFSVSMQREWNKFCSAVNLTITVTASANFNAVGNLVFRTVMVERLIQFSVQPGTNGETEFEDVAIKSFPSIQNGTPLASNWTVGQSTTFTLSCEIPSYTRKKEEIAFVGFIQDDGNRRVAQAVRADRDVLPAEALTTLGGKVDITCDGQITPVVSFKNSGSTALTSATIVPYIDGVPVGNVTTWSGNLAGGATETVTMNTISGTTVTGQHQFSYDVLLDVPVYNLIAANNKVAYVVASAYQGSPVAEGFVAATFPPADWSVINADGGPSFTRNTSAGGYNFSKNCVKYDFFTNPVLNDKDELYLPPVDLSGSDTPMLEFDLAYAQRDQNSNDRLEVFASDDCGLTWTNVFDQAGAQLTNTTPKASAYLPDPFDPAHWRTEWVSLPGFNKPQVIVKFVTTNNKGNNLFLDNINLKQNTPTGLADQGTGMRSVLYPNPASSEVNLRLESVNAGKAMLRVINTLGQVVLEQETSLKAGTNSILIDVKQYPAGIYNVVVSGDSGAVSSKLTLTK